MSDKPVDPLVEARKRIDAYLNIDIPLMVAREQLAEPQLFEMVGTLGLWMRATVGMVDEQIAEAIASFVQAVTDTYAYDARPVAEKLQIHIASAFKDNSALVQLRTMINEAMTVTPDDPASQASARFLQMATAAQATSESVAYFEILMAGEA